MCSSGPPFTIGIEEEYLLVDKETRSLVADPPKNLMAECEERCGAQVTPEFLRSQIEIGTKVCANIKEAEVELRRLRRIIIDVVITSYSIHYTKLYECAGHPELRQQRFDRHVVPGVAAAYCVARVHR